MAKKVKVKDIAAKVGLSSTLVSLVLNNKADQHGIKRETQERVMMIAHKMGFFQQKTPETREKESEESPGLVGMIVPSLTDPFVVDLIPYVHKALASIGIGFSVMTKDPFDRRFSRFVTGFRKLFSGMILVSEAADEATVRTLRAGDYPFIIMETELHNMRLNTVKSDMESGMRMMAEHIAGLGYTRISIIGREQPVESVRENIRLIREQLDALIPDVSIFDATVARIPGVNIIDTARLSEFMRPPYSTQLFVISEASLVYTVVDYFNRKGVRVPHDIAIVSLEDGAGFDLFSTSVTRIRKQVPELASKASRMIWTEIKNSGKGKFKRAVSIQPELIIGKSCGTHRQRV
ncbi:MAG: LacI family transcriptional regulator [Bacteroidales bacterium]|nr:LacI family transcriptional regulator [Bacteroidales bacterium]